mgnify:CR=1 FL=1
MERDGEHKEDITQLVEHRTEQERGVGQEVVSEGRCQDQTTGDGHQCSQTTSDGRLLLNCGFCHWRETDNCSGLDMLLLSFALVSVTVIWVSSDGRLEKKGLWHNSHFIKVFCKVEGRVFASHVITSM